MIELKRERSNEESNYGVGLRRLWLEVLGVDSLGLGRGMRNVVMREKRERRNRRENLWEERENSGLND